MIYEYAVDPGLLPHWAQKKHYDFWKKQFELGERRVVTAVSTKRKWKELARPILHRGDLNGGKDAARLAELFKLLSDGGSDFPIVERAGSSYDGTQCWLENALAEHRRVPFIGVLTHREDRAEQYIIDAKDYSVDHGHWTLPDERPVARTAEAFAAALGPMLRAARRVAFIDPHLNFDADRYRRTIRAMVQQFVAGPVVPGEVLFIVGPNCLNEDSMPAWLRRARKGVCPFPAGLLPQDLACRILIVKQRTGSQKVHDRFVLTDIGGARFTVGLDEGWPGETDGCHRLTKAHWEEAWSDYVECKGFDLVEEWE